MLFAFRGRALCPLSAARFCVLTWRLVPLRYSLTSSSGSFFVDSFAFSMLTLTLSGREEFISSFPRHGPVVSFPCLALRSPSTTHSMVPSLQDSPRNPVWQAPFDLSVSFWALLPHYAPSNPSPGVWPSHLFLSLNTYSALPSWHLYSSRSSRLI